MPAGYLITIVIWAAATALTPGEPGFQPGFETADTSVAGAVGLYGDYGPRERDLGLRSSLAGWVGPAAPPVLLLHGDRDTIVPVESARGLARALGALARGPVVLAELPGGQHGFDLFRSPRCAAAVDAVEVFATHVVAVR